MKIFISWSGELSHKVAELLYKQLPLFIQATKPWLSSQDIAAGTLWRTELAGQLEAQSVGIICITRDNMNSVWVNFEAGALSKTVDAARVIPFFFEMRPTDVTGPLADFNGTIYQSGSDRNRDQFHKLLLDISRISAPPLLQESVLDSLFSIMWPNLDSSLEAMAPKDRKSAGSSKVVDTGAVLQELVVEFRNLQALITSRDETVRNRETGTRNPSREFLQEITAQQHLVDKIRHDLKNLTNISIPEERQEAIEELILSTSYLSSRIRRIQNQFQRADPRATEGKLRVAMEEASGHRRRILESSGESDAILMESFADLYQMQAYFELPTRHDSETIDAMRDMYKEINQQRDSDRASNISIYKRRDGSLFFAYDTFNESS